jgi:hypothetical protein
VKHAVNTSPVELHAFSKKLRWLTFTASVRLSLACLPSSSSHLCDGPKTFLRSP